MTARRNARSAALLVGSTLSTLVNVQSEYFSFKMFSEVRLVFSCSADKPLTNSSLILKKEQGLKLGRPPGPGKSKLDQYRHEIEALLKNGSTQKFIAGRYKTTEANLHNWLKKNAVKRNKVQIL